MEFQTSPTSKNRLLATLPPSVYEQLLPFLELEELTIKDVLQEPQAPMSHVYFPLNCVASIVVTMEDGVRVEAATVGNEGMVGLSVFLGSDTMPTTTLVQVPGQALRLPKKIFFETFKNLESLRGLMERYTQAMFIMVAQSAACNRVHTITQRCARWLLMTQDRAGREQFSLTQEFLAQMLGVRRAGVSEVASSLQQAELIEYTRGIITIKDRVGLLAQACECYSIIQQEFERSLS
jgi:CRP-like cAMP-binding protein